MDREQRELKDKAEGGGRKAEGQTLGFALGLMIRPLPLGPRRRSERRGVLLLVVLSMLVLFMLIGTAFLMTSGQSRDAAKAAAKKGRLGNSANEDQERVLMQLLRDTENKDSAAHTHSLLRDFYGTDGFSAVAYRFNEGPPSDPAANDLAKTEQTTRYAGAFSTVPNFHLGPTQGQFIDIYFKALAFNTSAAPPRSTQDPHTVEDETRLTAPDARHVLKLDPNPYGQPQVHSLPLTKGYYNGCLLTVTSGPAAGQSARILDYECINSDLIGNGTGITKLYRLRVMAFGRADGGSLFIDAARSPEITDLAGASFIVNGRPFNGTGVGYNPLAVTGQARLTAMQVMPVGTTVVGAETALTPNARFLNLGLIAAINPTIPIPPGLDHFTVGGAVNTLVNDPTAAYIWLNDPNISPLLWPYQTPMGSGDADEGYDAADFQNLFLALQTVTPRSQGRIVTSNSVGLPVSEFLADPSNAGNFLRLDLEDMPMPSFHRPDLVNFWYHRLLHLLVASGVDPNVAVQAILQPYDPNTGTPHVDLDPQQAALITAIKRKIVMRPIREDHPRFDGGNPESVAFDYTQVGDFADAATGRNITVPIWEIVGPWDVDNDNDGVNDSVWLDFGDPVQELENGTRVKKLYAPLIIDLDSRLNANAHGLVDQIDQLPGDGSSDPAALAAAYAVNGNFMIWNLAGRLSSNSLPQGMGYGPAETSLRPVFGQPWSDDTGTRDENANRSESTGLPIDDYAAILAGRELRDGTSVTGRYGYAPSSLGAGAGVAPGTNYQFLANPASRTGEMAVPEMPVQLKLFDYPWTLQERSAFGTPPDLMGRYALGLDYSGQPYYEVLNDTNASDPSLPRALLTDSPYELDISGKRRRAELSTQFATQGQAFTSTVGPAGLNDDGPYSLADLERVLRAWDADSGTLPSRLWEVVNAFDPQKLLLYDTWRTLGYANELFNQTNIAQNSPEHLAAAQNLAGINRRLITTDSFSPPVPSITPPAYLLTHSVPKIQAALNMRPPKTVAEMYEVRIRKEFGMPTLYDEYEPGGDHDGDYDPNNPDTTKLNANDPEYNNAPTAAARVGRAKRISAIIGAGVWTDASNKSHVEPGVLAPEVIAGKRMDLNRPLGDGRDNPDGFDNDGNNVVDEQGELGDVTLNGVVDDPRESGDPYLDINGNGKRDDDAFMPPSGEPYIDVDGNGVYSPPCDQLWQNLTLEQLAFDYTQGNFTPIHPIIISDVQSAFNGVPFLGGIRNLESHGRQLFARHLYCLMLLLVDENYIAPWDENDPQIKEYLDITTDKSLAKRVREGLGPIPDPNPVVNAYDQNARRIMLRKLTCKAIAQWAVNCVDMRDADAIMTLFEYDENPWDGWSVPARDGTFIPIDGDAGTDENGDLVANETVVLDWKTISESNGVKSTKVIPTSPQNGLFQTRNMVWGAERPELLITETLALHDRRTEDTGTDFTAQTLEGDGSSGTTDDDLDQRLRPKGSLFVELYNPWSPTGQYPAELYSLFNTKDGSLNPDFDGDGDIDDRNGDGLQNSDDVIVGVELGRLSSLGARELTPANTAEKDKRYQLTAEIGNRIARSPVWRMIVVEEHPAYRNNLKGIDGGNAIDGPIDDPDNNQSFDNEVRLGLRTPIHTKPMTLDAKAYFEAADPDRSFFGNGWPNGAPNPTSFENKPYVERSIYFTSDNSTRFGRQDAEDPSTGNENFLSLDQRHTSPGNNKVSDRLRLPAQYDPISARYFIAADVSKAPLSGGGGANVGDVPIAPIRPGQYALVATAGAQYSLYDPDNPANLTRDLRTGRIERTTSQTINGVPTFINGVPRYVTTITRQDMGGGVGTMMTNDDDVVSMLETTRRIELRPHWNPNYQQVLVASNGGTPVFPRPFDKTQPDLPNVARRDNEIISIPTNPRKFYNVYDGSQDPTSLPPNYVIAPDSDLIPPCVAIPIKDLSLSEPLDLYAARRAELDSEERQRADDDPTGELESQGHWYNPEAGNGEGSFVTDFNANQRTPTAYDTPFDMAPELRRNGTTRNYRTIHLQRLADPTLPWNPLPTLPDGSDNPQHDPKLPVNMYRTIDSSSVDLTAFNGTSARETAESDVEQERRWLPPNTIEFRNMFSEIPGTPPSPDRIHMRTLERGTHAQDVIAKNGAANIPVDIAARALWRQEPINAFVDMQTWLYVDPNSANPTPQQKRFSEMSKRANEHRLRDRETLDLDISAIGSEEDPEFNNFPAPLKPERPSHFDFVLDHTLGYTNESFGGMYSRTDLQSNGLPASASGTPSPDYAGKDKFPFTQHDPGIVSPILSTYPWMAWNNRPFISASELLNVPATSSSQMLRQYSTVFQTLHNPYDGTGFDNTGTAISVGNRLAAYLSPYGHLFSAFQTAGAPAGVVSDASGPVADADGNWQFIGAPHFYRILDYVHAPSRFVGTDTLFTAEVFNDAPPIVDPVGSEITGPQDPRANFRPPFNKVSRERDPGKVNLNTVTGRRAVDPAGIRRIWSEVFDGIMHRDRDMNHIDRASHLGPAWRDVVLSRRGYAQQDAAGTMIDKTPTEIPDTYMYGLNYNFPSVFSNPFRSPDAGDLVPLKQMVHFGIDASWQRRHHYNRGGRNTWGSQSADDDDPNSTRFVTKDDTREAGFGGDSLVFDPGNGELLPSQSTFPDATDQSGIPLFSESFTGTSIDGERNPYFYYQPMTRMENLVTNRSNVFAIWITVGYFEVEPAPNWNDPDTDRKEAIRARFGGTLNDGDAATIAGLALYNRVYPDGYMLGREVGSDTGDVKRPRGFFIVDRTEEVGFKPGEDLNVERAIKVRRRIE